MLKGDFPYILSEAVEGCCNEISAMHLKKRNLSN
jgi:hypothetical protein